MLEKLKEIIVQFADVNPDDITENSTLRADLGLSSFDIVNLSVALEEVFEVEFEESEIPTLNTVGDIIVSIEEKSED